MLSFVSMEHLFAVPEVCLHIIPVDDTENYVTSIRLRLVSSSLYESMTRVGFPSGRSCLTLNPVAIGGNYLVSENQTWYMDPHCLYFAVKMNVQDPRFAYPNFWQGFDSDIGEMKINVRTTIDYYPFKLFSKSKSLPLSMIFDARICYAIDAALDTNNNKFIDILFQPEWNEHFDNETRSMLICEVALNEDDGTFIEQHKDIFQADVVRDTFLRAIMRNKCFDLMPWCIKHALSIFEKPAVEIAGFLLRELMHNTTYSLYSREFYRVIRLCRLTPKRKRNDTDPNRRATKKKKE